MSKVKIIEQSLPGGKVAIFNYEGDSDPVSELDEAIAQYVRGTTYKEFIDMNMDNPWVRVITTESLFNVDSKGWTDFNDNDRMKQII